MHFSQRAGKVDDVLESGYAEDRIEVAILEWKGTNIRSVERHSLTETNLVDGLPCPDLGGGVHTQNLACSEGCEGPKHCTFGVTADLEKLEITFPVGKNGCESPDRLGLVRSEVGTARENAVAEPVEAGVDGRVPVAKRARGGAEPVASKKAHVSNVIALLSTTHHARRQGSR